MSSSCKAPTRSVLLRSSVLHDLHLTAAAASPDAAAVVDRVGTGLYRIVQVSPELTLSAASQARA